MTVAGAVGRADLEAVAAALGSDVAAVRELTEGTFNAAYLLELADGRRVVVKVEPEPGTPVLTYEDTLLHTEALCLRTFGARTAVPVPRLLHTGRTGGGREYVVTSVLPGASWFSRRERIDGPVRRVLRRQVGELVAGLHTVTGDGGFGYPAPGSALTAPTWAGAYQRIVAALLADADRFGVRLPRPAGEIGALLRAAAAEHLADVRTPVLVHFDLWDGNVFVDLDGPAPVVTGFIDQERALWADPAVDFVSLALFGEIDDDLVAGYRDAGGPVTFDAATRARLHLYAAHLALIMTVECAPRGTPARPRVDAWLSRELDAIERPVRG